jgi:uncharacterized membrane protein
MQGMQPLHKVKGETELCMKGVSHRENYHAWIQAVPGSVEGTHQVLNLQEQSNQLR